MYPISNIIIDLTFQQNVINVKRLKLIKVLILKKTGKEFLF